MTVPQEQHHDADFDEAAFTRTARLLKEEIGVTIEMYLEDAARYTANIKAALNEGDTAKAALNSHPLKSNSLGLGLVRVSAAAKAINEAALDGDITTCRAALPELEDALKIAAQTLHGALKKAEEKPT